MASVSMAVSFLGGAATLAPAASGSQRRLVITNSVKATAGKVSSENKQEESGSNGRREMVFAAAAAALCSVAGMAMAEEPKRGTAAAKKAYASVCVANPTAKICNY